MGNPLAAVPPPRMKDGHRTWNASVPADDVLAKQFRLGPEELGPKASGCSVVKQTLQDGIRSGVETIEIDNGRIRFIVLPTRGMGIWQAHCRDVRLGWDSPVRGPVHPAFVHLDEPSGLGWLAGFDEMLVRCGLEYNGGPEFKDNGVLRYGLHGRIANIPAQDVTLSVDSENGSISVRGVVYETRLFGTKLRMTSTIGTQPGRAQITVHDSIENISSELSELELIYHTNFGPPLLEPGSTIVASVKKVIPCDDVATKGLPSWNIMGKETAGAKEQCFFCDLSASDEGRTGVLLRSADRRKAVYYQFNKKQLPCFTVWKNQQCKPDGYVVGLEPGTNYPNTKSVEKEQGRVISLAPGERRAFELVLEYLDDLDAIGTVEEAIREMTC